MAAAVATAIKMAVQPLASRIAALEARPELKYTGTWLEKHARITLAKR